MIRMFGLGEKTETTPQDAVPVERVLGMARKGRRQTTDGAGPWLTGPAEDLLSAAAVVALPNLAERADYCVWSLPALIETVAALLTLCPVSAGLSNWKLTVLPRFAA